MAAAAPRADARTDRFPPQIPFIIGNEACERFSFYGMRAVLTIFLADYLLRETVGPGEDRAAIAKSHFHLFMFGVYWFPLVGGWLADRVFGKFKVIFWLSLVYCLGHACLAFFEDVPTGFYLGLLLIAVGSGGIKPCVAAMVGDQFTEANKHLINKVFSVFYWSINLGSFFAALFIPAVLAKWGPAVAFGIPGVLMLLATIIFWAGRRHYVVVPPTRHDPHSFLRVVGSALRGRGKKAPGSHWLDAARAEHPELAVEGSKAVLRLVLLFIPVMFFWMIFDQKASTLVLQAKVMDPHVGPFTFQPSQIQIINPALVMLLIPLLTLGVYPLVKRTGWELTPLRRMPLGMVLCAASYAIAGLFQIRMDAGQVLNIAWMVLPYAVLTVAEILVSTTGLEFAYTQAPREMKSVVQSLWLMATALANIFVAFIARIDAFKGPSQFFFYGTLALLAGLMLWLVARKFKVRDYYQGGGTPVPTDGREAAGTQARPA
ncbi:POT family MFS transporter [Aggregicoccus sp. 17bor-14]|uniref:POT family MFS transporter n=1 Tax=Myxococcaceae TaxID=31 RepID=UPI00129D15D2|nr:MULTISPECIES: POT family MFS transporter [Myxococcaceae]MBF5041478.1 POT family MFS transporter [Simulacricoccus sp. 17bor-14]MRI87262.1 POT family MFS transporter [Aggregicoccus sp. 17bor-14]